MRSSSRDEEEEEQLKRKKLQDNHLSKVMGHKHKVYIRIVKRMKAITGNYRNGRVVLNLTAHWFHRLDPRSCDLMNLFFLQYYRSSLVLGSSF